MRFRYERWLIAFFCCISATAAQAQICKETGFNINAPSGYSTITCDNTYKDLKVTCDNNAKNASDQTDVGTHPSCPPKPMPMITTPLASYIESYSPYLFAYARDRSDKTKSYNGPFATGTSGGPDKVHNMFGNVGSPDENDKTKAPKPIASCVDQIRLPQSPNYGKSSSDLQKQAKYERLKFDNCINQYILNTAFYPFHDSRSKLINDPNQSSAYVSLQTQCQPIKVHSSLLDDNEYDVTEYLKAAWKKTLSQPTFRKSKTTLHPNMFTMLAKNKGGLSYPTINKNKHEPHLPTGVKLENPLDVPDVGDKVKPSHIAATPYEKINDPTHPFSPRWDFLFTEREFYSPMTDGYMNKTENTVYCAGVKEAKNESDDVKKANLEVPVDVLSFRESAFTNGIVNRIAYNTVCKKDADNKQEQDGEFFSLLMSSYCVKMNVANMATCYTTGANCDRTGTQKPCWKCFGLDGKLDEDQNPPCSTRYDEKDLKVKGSLVFGGLYNGFAKRASCNPVFWFRQSKNNIDKLCNNLRKPYTQINRLKMRYDDPAQPDSSPLTSGVQEGFRFTDYFGHHMPYPRMWDTGTSLHKTKQNDTDYQGAEDTTGQFAVIVGVGREGAPKIAGEDAMKAHPDQRCLLGGWGGDEEKDSSNPTITGTRPSANFLGSGEIKVPDPITSWTEFKAYQMRTQRLTNMSCIGRYEKVFKPGSSENIALKVTGGEWTNIVIQVCDKTNTNDCKFMTLKEYKAGGSNNTGKTVITQSKLESWPISWRGYIVAGTPGDTTTPHTADGANQFPNFGKTGGFTAIAGLANAQLGDIVLLPRGSTGTNDKPGLAKVAIVSEVNLPNPANATRAPGNYIQDCKYDVSGPKSPADCYVQVLEADNGKFPDVCGTTDAFGELKNRYLYAPNTLPKVIKDSYNRINSTISCEDSRLLKCEMKNYKDAILYRIRGDIREGCTKEKTTDCT